MRFIVAIICSLFTLLSSAVAQDSLTTKDVQVKLLRQLEVDGYLSTKMASEAREKYVSSSSAKVVSDAEVTGDKGQSEEGGFWRRYVSLSNFVKLVAIAFILYACSGIIRNLINGVWHILVKIPPFAYQVPLLSASIFSTASPQAIWDSQSFYVALFAALLNVAIVGWILAIYPKIAEFLASLFKLGIPIASVISFWMMLYFGGLALHYQSQVFGFFTAIALSGVLTFSLYYKRGVLTLYFNENAINAVVFGHLVVLVAYSFMKIGGMLPAEASYFAVGLQYYCTIALCVGLLCGAQPYEDGVGLYVLLFIVTLAAATAGYFFYDLKVIGIVVICFFVLFLLEWIAYYGYKAGAIVGSLVIGASLYATALAFESYGRQMIRVLI